MPDLLPSGLPDLVADEEDLARFLRSSNQFSSSIVKASAFLPARDDRTSVARHGAEPRAVDVVAAEPPPRHADLVRWPVNADPELQKAQRKEVALAIAAQSALVRRD